jgi:hypothetical protein
MTVYRYAKSGLAFLSALLIRHASRPVIPDSQPSTLKASRARLPEKRF